MKRLLSITLLLLIGLPLISPLLAMGSDPDSNLPACCRHNGKHHCMMSLAQKQALLHGEQFSAVSSKCPLYPRATTPAHRPPYSFQQTAALFTNVISQPEKLRQIEAWARVALEDARHKRGPPAVRLS